jgi:hypothetical protein
MFSRITIAVLLPVFCLGFIAANGAEPTADHPATKRSVAPTATLMSSAAEQAIKSVLAVETISVDVADQPLSEWTNAISDRYNIPIQFNANALKDATIDPTTTPVGVQFKDISLRAALKLILDEHKLAYLVRNDVLLITTQEVAKGAMAICVYDVDDFLTTESAGAKLIDTITEAIEPSSWQKYQGSGTAQLFDNGDIRVLVVSQNQDNQERIAALLKELRSFKQAKAAKTSAQAIASAPKKKKNK